MTIKISIKYYSWLFDVFIILLRDLPLSYNVNFSFLLIAITSSCRSCRSHSRLPALSFRHHSDSYCRLLCTVQPRVHSLLNFIFGYLCRIFLCAHNFCIAMVCSWICEFYYPVSHQVCVDSGKHASENETFGLLSFSFWWVSPVVR